MKINILLSTYNGEKYLAELLDSLLEMQLIQYVTLVIRDDNSLDDTEGIIELYKDKFKIVFIKGKNVGPKESFHELIMESPEADYYAFCDQDDIWKSDKLKIAIEKIQKIEEKKNNIPILYFGNVEMIDADGNLLHKNRDLNVPKTQIEQLFVANPALGCTMIYNNSLHELLKKISFESFFMHDVVTILLARSYGEIIYDKNPCMYYREHINSVTQGVDVRKNIKNKIDFWFIQRQINIASEAKELLKISLKTKGMPIEIKMVLEEISGYKKGLSRFKIAFSKKYRVDSYKCNRSFIIRMLLGLA